MRKSEKITFETINAGKYTVIDPKKIAESEARIRKNMEVIVRENNKKLIKSEIAAGKIIINS